MLATNKTIISDPDSKFHKAAVLESEILAFWYIKKAEIKTERDFLQRSPVTGQDRAGGDDFKWKYLDWT